MIGINSINLTSLRQPRKFFDPARIADCIAWYDFTDVQKIFTDVAGTARPSDGAEIKRVDNKAYWAKAMKDSQHGINDNAIAKFIQQDSATKYPTWDNTNKCLVFDGSNDHLFATKSSSGAIDTNKLSSTNNFSQLAFTSFAVFRSDNASGSVSNDSTVFGLASVQPGSISLRIDNDGSNDEIFATIMNADRSSGAENNIDSGVDATTNKEFWNFSCTGSSAGILYRNGNTSSGITNASISAAYTMNFTANDANNKFYVGSTTAPASYFDGRIYEIIIYNRALSTFEIKQVNQYLSNKHKIEIG